jgi:hypothetical protein
MPQERKGQKTNGPSRSNCGKGKIKFFLSDRKERGIVADVL